MSSPALDRPLRSLAEVLAQQAERDRARRSEEARDASDARVARATLADHMATMRKELEMGWTEECQIRAALEDANWGNSEKPPEIEHLMEEAIERARTEKFVAL